jgi:K+-sensing histidine kinase KdpD
MNVLVVQCNPNAPAPEMVPAPDVPLECRIVSSLDAGLEALSEDRYDTVVADAATLSASDGRFRSVFQRTQGPTCQLILAIPTEEEIPAQTLAAGVDGCVELPLRLSAVWDLLYSRMKRDEELLERRTDLRQKDEEIATLVAISNLVTSNLEFIPLLEAMAHQTSKAMDADRTTIFMYDAEKQHLEAAFAEGLGPYSITVPATHGIAGYVATQRKMVNVVNAYQDPRFYNEIDRETGYITRTILCVPLISPTGNLIGVVQCLNKRTGPFREGDERIFSMLSPLFAISIENALLYKDLQEEVRHNEQIMAEKIQAERLAVVGKMARSVTRDIAGPMEDIVTHAVQLSREEVAPEEREGICRAIEEVVDRLVGLAQELLDFSRDNLELTINPYTLLEFVHMLQLHLESQSLLIHDPPDSPHNRQIQIDAEKLMQALACIATVLYTYERQRVALRTDLKATELYFVFSPLSSQTTAAVMRILTDPFANTEEEQTIGLKIAVARRIISLHGGTVSAEAQGLCVCIPHHQTGG